MLSGLRLHGFHVAEGLDQSRLMRRVCDERLLETVAQKGPTTAMAAIWLGSRIMIINVNDGLIEKSAAR